MIYTSEPLFKTRSTKNFIICMRQRRSDVEKEKFESCEQNFKVVIRIRPPLKREIQSSRGFKNCVLVDQNQKCNN